MQRFPGDTLHLETGVAIAGEAIRDRDGPQARHENWMVAPLSLLAAEIPTWNLCRRASLPPTLLPRGRTSSRTSSRTTGPAIDWQFCLPTMRRSDRLSR